MKPFQTAFVFLLSICLWGCVGSLSQRQSISQNRFLFSPPDGFNNASYFFDRVSGTTWRRCDLGKKYSTTESKCVGQSITASWPEAVAIVQKLNKENFEGASNWRLPAKADLASLFLNEPSFREIHSMRHSGYGFGSTR